MFAYAGPRSEFDITFEVICQAGSGRCSSDDNPRGRNFIFGGRSALCEWPTPAPTQFEWDVCAYTDQDLEIEGAEILINNLGNLGPENSVEGVLRYFDVVKNAPGGQQIDLIVSVAPSSDYDVADNSYNGKWEEFA
mmetsp:Transcript_21212/g.25498  ORF Transcript_21212/g.25498 Transcript_21212/m.25498 type:complete len:136 (+) Transcript_21212:1621-2028(+)